MRIFVFQSPSVSNMTFNKRQKINIERVSFPLRHHNGWRKKGIHPESRLTPICFGLVLLWVTIGLSTYHLRTSQHLLIRIIQNRFSLVIAFQSIANSFMLLNGVEALLWSAFKTNYSTVQCSAQYQVECQFQRRRFMVVGFECLISVSRRLRGAILYSSSVLNKRPSLTEPECPSRES